MRRQRILVGGGARSGKSAFALRRGRQLGERRVFVATAQALDDEMRDRVSRHRAERGEEYATIEEPIDLPGALSGLAGAAARGGGAAPDVAVVDCLTLWLANLVLRGDGDDAIDERIDALGRVLDDPPCHVILVSNEVGFGIVPDNALSRRFRDVVGVAHQRLSARCDELYLAALGVVLRLRPEPVAVVPGGAPGEAGA